MADTLSLDVNKADRLDTQKRQTTGSDKLGKDEFMKLLITQLKNQDPTSPADSTAFVAQLAQFSTLEMMQNSNTNLEKLILGQSNARKTELAGIVGKEVTFRSDTLTLDDKGKATTTYAAISADATEVTAVVNDADGRAIRTLRLGPNTAGVMEIKWDGREESGNFASAGTYTVTVTAADKAGNNISVDQHGRGRVTGVSLDSAEPELMLGDDRIKFTNVIEIQEQRSTQ